jgi:hypothetical protein
LIEHDTGALRLKRTPNDTEMSRAYVLQLRAVNITSGESDQAQVFIKLRTIFQLYYCTTFQIRLYVFGSNGSQPVEGNKAFVPNQFWITVPENGAPDMFIIDLNSTYEVNARPTRYSFSAAQPFGKQNIHI